MMLSGLDLIKAYRENPDDFLPVLIPKKEIPGRNEYGEVNIGWNAGLLEENRPFFAECWAVDQMIMLTICVSAKGIEEKTAEEIDQWFQNIGYYSYRAEKRYPANVRKEKYPGGEVYFIINLLVGAEDEPAQIDGASIFPWSILNEYNRKYWAEQA